MPDFANILDVIEARTSCRTYQPKWLEPQVRKNLEDFLAGLQRAPFPGTWRFRLVTPTFKSDGRQEKIGTYGTITGARHFIAGVIRQEPQALLNYGYLMERIILEATNLGLGTCWLGGAFHRGDFADKLERQKDELLPAVTPVGIPADKPTMQDRLTRISARASTRKPFESLFFKLDFKNPLTRNAAGSYAKVLEMVRLAPSASNRQPWRVVLSDSGDAFHFFLQRNVLYGKVTQLIGTDDLQQIDMGIAMCHFELAAEALKLKGRWQLAKPNFADLPPATSYMVSWIIG